MINETLASKEYEYVQNLKGLEKKYTDNTISHIQKKEEECKDHEYTKSLLSK